MSRSWCVLAGLLWLASPAQADVGGFFDAGVGAVYGRYRSTTVHEEKLGSSTGDSIITTKKKAGSGNGFTLAVRGGVRVGNVSFAGFLRSQTVSLELPDTSSNNRGDTFVGMPYATSLHVVSFGAAIGYARGGWFGHLEAGEGSIEFSAQPCLCLHRASGGDVLSAGVEAGYQARLNADWVVRPAAALTATWIDETSKVDFLDTFATKGRLVGASLMVSVAYQR